MNKNLNLTFTANNNELKMGSDQSIKIVSINGLEASDYVVHTFQNATHDGSIVSGKKVEERIIEVVASTDSYTDKEILRNQLIHFFNPKESYKLYVDYCGSKAVIDCELKGFKATTEESLWGDFEVTITLLCPYPYFSDLDNFGKNIASTTPMFALPMGFVTFNQNHLNTIKQPVSYITLSSEVVLENKGDVETGLEIVFIAKKGAVKNPKITNINTGEFIEIVCDMQMGDEIRVNTNVGKKNIYLNGESIFKQKNKLSTFFNLKKGDNKVSYDAAQNKTNLEVRLYYSPKYLGV